MSHEPLNPIDLVDDYVHDLLAPLDRERVERFCEEHEDGREALAAARARAEALRSLPPVEAPEALVRATVDGIERRTVRGRTYRRWFLGTVGSITVASLLIVGGFHAYYASLKASPYDVRMLGQRQLLAGSRASVRLAVYDNTADRPIAGIPVRLAIHRTGAGQDGESVDLGETTTDENGIAQPIFDLPDWDAGTYEIRIVANTSAGDEVLVESVELTRSWQVMLSTDKPVYKPGQTIHVRALSLRRPNLKPVVGANATYTVSDPKGNVIYRETDVTGDYGITATDCLLATEIIEGPYTIDCTVGDTTSSVTVDVEQYVLPKFRVDLALDAPFYAPGDTVRATLQADYFFGKPVGGADVLLQATTDDQFGEPLHDTNVKTDDAGHVIVEFTLPQEFVGIEQHSGNAGVRVVAQVTDTAGQKQATAVSRIVTSEPIHVEVVPEMGQLVKGVANKVYLFTSTADGRPAETRVKVTGVDRELTTSKLGVATFELTPESDEVRLTVVATSTNDTAYVGRRHVVLVPGDVPRDFVLRTDKAVYTGGESMSVTLLGGGVEPVFLDFVKDGQTVLTRTVDVGAGQGDTTFDLPADLFGTLRLCAYRFGKDGLPVMKIRTVYIGRAEQLTITTKHDHETYRPGGEATVEFTLTDADGKPVPGALSLAAVDEAVFHVLKQRPGLEGTFFQLQRDLLEPVYAIYGGWSPEAGDGGAVPLAERVEFEQALFARTTRIANDFDPRAEQEIVLEEPLLEDGMEPDFFGEPEEFDEPGAFGIPGAEGFDENDLEDGELGGTGDSPLADETTTSSPLTLVAASYAGKVERVLQQRKDGMTFVRTAWLWVIVWTLVASFAVLAVVLPKEVFLALVVVVVVPGVIATLLPAVQQSREAAMLADMKQAGPEEMWGFGGGMGGGFGGGGGFLGGDFGVDESEVAYSEEVGSDPIRVRRAFPETLLWRPQLVTDEHGKATLTLPLADSITTWRLTASAVSGDGRLGALQDGVRVFQPFFVDLDLPAALVRNDEVSVPVVVYNYLDEPQTVELELARADWFALLDGEVNAGDEAVFRKIELGPGEVRSTHYRLRAKDVGTQRLMVTARANGVADALEREIAVHSDGRRVETVVNGSLDQPANVELIVPENAIPGSVTAVVKLYPSGFSQLVEGLDGIFQQPYGCFEQTSSTTYPNILALQYLRESGQSVPEVEAKARQFIHLGYQKLLGFEVDGGGFDWFGNPPANVTLTAYGLLEFEDMAKVHDVDPALIERTRNWLLMKRGADGSWRAEEGMLDDGLAGSVQRGRDLNLATTAYVAWAVFGHGKANEGRATLDYLLSKRPEAIENPYTLAMVANALLALDPRGPAADAYVQRLVALRKSSDDGTFSWWELGENEQTSFYGSGNSGSVEVTALATLALLEAKAEPAITKAALGWLVKEKGSNGTWPSTQATVLALQALVRGTSAPLGGDKARSFEIAIGDEVIREWTVPADQAEVVQQVNLSDRLAPGSTSIRIRETTDTGTGYQVAFRYHVPETDVEPETEPLSIDLVFDRTDLKVDDTIVATATVRNNMEQEAPMVIVDLPIPAGFRLDPIELEELKASGDIAKYQVNARTAVVYLRGLTPGQSLELKYRLDATMPVKLTVPPATVYEYYDRDINGRGKPLELVVGERT